MPSVTGKSALFAKYGARADKAVKEHINDPIEYGGGFGQLPGNIKDGIAQVYECGFGQVAVGKQNAGEWYYSARATVKRPSEHEGKQTSEFEMLCDTKTAAGNTTTLEEHFQSVLNRLKMLWGEGFPTEINGKPTGAEHLEAIAAEIEKAKPHIRFTTSESTKETIDPKTKKPLPKRVFENWLGVKGVEGWSPEMSNGQVTDDDDHTGAASDQSKVGGGGATGEGGDAGTDPDADGSLSALAAAADGEGAKPGKATEAMVAYAREAGLTDEDMAAAGATWADVVQEIRRRAGFEADTAEGEPEAEAEPEAEPEPEGPAIPEKGGIWKWSAKKGQKAKEYEIASVNADKGFVTLKDLSTKKVVQNSNNKPLAVKFEDLTPT